MAVTRKADRLRLPIPPGSSTPAYMFESLDYQLAERRMEAFLAEFQEGGIPSEPHQHGTEEMIYVIKGALAVVLDEERTTLGEGDAMAFDSSVLHSYQREGSRACTALVVTVA